MPLVTAAAAHMLRFAIRLWAWAVGPLPISHFLVKSAAGRKLLLVNMKAGDPDLSVSYRPWSDGGRRCSAIRVCCYACAEELSERKKERKIAYRP
jgi:hypothetical protein